MSSHGHRRTLVGTGPLQALGETGYTPGHLIGWSTTPSWQRAGGIRQPAASLNLSRGTRQALVAMRGERDHEGRVSGPRSGRARFGRSPARVTFPKLACAVPQLQSALRRLLERGGQGSGRPRPRVTPPDDARVFLSEQPRFAVARSVLKEEEHGRQTRPRRRAASSVSRCRCPTSSWMPLRARRIVCALGGAQPSRGVRGTLPRIID